MTSEQAVPRAVEAILAAFADALPDIVFLCDEQFLLKYANRAWFGFTGLTRDGSAGVGWADAVHAEDLPAFRARFVAMSGTQERYDVEFRLRRADGVFRWMRCRAAPFANPLTGERAWIGTCLDIDDAKQAESERDAFRVLVDSGALGIMVASPSGSTILDVNERFLAMTGYERREVIAGALTWQAMTPPEWAEADASAVREYRETGAVKPYEKELYRRDGTRIPVLIGVAGSTADRVIVYLTDLTDLKRSQAAQRASASRLQRLVDANVVGIVIANNAGAILEANDAFLNMLGFTRDDLERGLVDWRNLTPPEWLPLDERAIEDLATHGEFRRYEKEYLRRDGSRVPVALGGARIAGADDEQICYIIDLSEQRRAVAALRRSESRFARLAGANVFGVMTSRYSDNTIVEANDEFLRTIGYSREDVEARRIRWTEITPPEWQEVSRLATIELRETGRFAPVEKEYVRKNGTRVPVLVGGAFVEGSQEEVSCFVLDLTEQREANRRLIESEQRYRMLADAVPGIIMLTGADRCPIFVNRQYETYTGLTVDDLPTKWRDAIHPDDLPAVDRARATGEAYEVEYRLRGVDGTYRWHFARVLELPDGASDARWLGAALDVDDRKRAEQSLQFIEKAGARLARSLDVETTFETLLDLVVPEFGDWAIINLRDETGVVKTSVARHSDPSRDRAARSLRGVSYYQPSLDWGTAGALQTGKPQLVPHVGREEMQAAIKPEYMPIFDELGYGSIVALPIFSGDEIVGSFGIVSEGGRRVYTEADLLPLEVLARRAGFAIANARQYEREHRVASLLQDAALPGSLPFVDGFAFDAYYRAGRQEALIGGDWYDVIVGSDGRIVVSVGDVAGSGLHAAVLMSNVRQMIRAAANVSTDPMLMLDIADRTLRGERDDRMVTAFVGVIDPKSRTMQYASAGHLPALLRGPTGTMTALTTAGLPLGYRDIAGRESGTTILPPGSCLLLYTDGLVEWSRDIVAGEALLRQRFAELLATDRSCSAKALVESILSPGGARDDVAALTIAVAARRPSTSSG